jgi:hypothetical protein
LNERELYTYRTSTINWVEMSEETVKLVKETYDIDLNGVWYNGRRLCVDIKRTVPFGFDKDESSSVVLTDAFIQTFLSYPNINEVELLIDGVRNCEGRFFKFGTFRQRIN